VGRQKVYYHQKVQTTFGAVANSIANGCAIQANGGEVVGLFWQLEQSSAYFEEVRM
jgi:hypothetical protein